jgi:hypothetical protein
MTVEEISIGQSSAWVAVSASAVNAECTAVVLVSTKQ